MTGGGRPWTAGAVRLRRGAVGFALLFLVLEGVSRAGIVDRAWLPPASTVVAAAAGLLLDPTFLVHIGGTLTSWAIGLTLATVLAVPLGLAIGSSERRRTAGSAVIEMLRPIPSVALIPLAVLLLGRGIDMRVALVIYAASWPILLNTIAGVRQVDPLARETARAFGLSRRTAFRVVDLPSAAPFIATGLRVSSGIALIVAISAELIAGGPPGIGTWMLASSQGGVPRELAYAGIVIAGVLGVALNGLIVALERRWLAWHPRMRSRAA